MATIRPTRPTSDRTSERVFSSIRDRDTGIMDAAMAIDAGS
jgi:16S rRNA G966 N2-methylase RsmD